MGSPSKRQRILSAVTISALLATLVAAAATPASAAHPAGIISTVFHDPPIGVQHPTATPDGSIYIDRPTGLQGPGPKVERVNPDGTTTTIYNAPWCNSTFPGEPCCPLDIYSEPPGLFCNLYDLAAGPDGNLYAVTVDEGNDGGIISTPYLWRLTPGGELTMLAGGGTNDPADGGLAVNTQMWTPAGVTVDPDGNILYTDSRGYIFQVDPSGVVSTVAGTGTAGFSGDGGLATEAQVSSLRDLEVDDDGRIFVVANRRVRMIDTDGIITTVAGTGQSGFSGDGGPAIDARIGSSPRLALGPEGELYLSGPARVRMVDADGVIDTVVGTGVDASSGDGGPATLAEIDPLGMVVETSGDLLVADAEGRSLRRVTWSDGFVVDTTADTVDAVVGDGECEDAGGLCSLRAAVQEANADPDATTITLPAGAYPLTRAGRNENAGATGDLDVTGPVTIAGLGAPTITGGGLDRVFEVRVGGALTLEGVTVSGGDPGVAAGGAILANPSTTLTLTDATVDANTAFVGGGIVSLGAVTIDGGGVTNNTAGKDAGGIFVLGAGSLDITGTTIADNTAARYAGGIATLRGASLTDVTIGNNTAAAAGGLYAGGTGTLTITGSTITENTATQANAFGGGFVTELATTVDTTRISSNDADIVGGVLALNALTVTDSTIDHNTADVAIGGVGAAGSTLEITNSTISANTTAGFAGGLGVATTATLTNVTVTDNSAATGAAGIYTLAPGEAGTAGGNTTLSNMIIADQSLGDDCGGGGPITSGGYNLDTTNTCDLTAPTDLPGAPTAALGALADNGGPTVTHLPDGASPAVDTIPAGTNGCGTTITTDQRATSRPQGTHCDAGAVEV